MAINTRRLARCLRLRVIVTGRCAQSWQQSSQASPKLRFGLLGVFLEVDLACLLDDVVIRDLIWELIKGLTDLFQKQKEKFVQTITVLGEL